MYPFESVVLYPWGVYLVVQLLDCGVGILVPSWSGHLVKLAEVQL